MFKCSLVAFGCCLDVRLLLKHVVTAVLHCTLYAAESPSQNNVEAPGGDNTLFGCCQHLIAGSPYCGPGPLNHQQPGPHGHSRPQSGCQPWTEDGDLSALAFLLLYFSLQEYLSVVHLHVTQAHTHCHTVVCLRRIYTSSRIVCSL